MKSMDGEQAAGRKKFTLPDIFIIVGVILLLLAVIGQDIAVYVTNKEDMSERYEIDFEILSIDETSAKSLIEERSKVDVMILTYENKELGSVNGGLMLNADSLTGGYKNVSGTLSAAGRTVDGAYRLYGYDRSFRAGDRLYVLFEDSDGAYTAKGYTIELTSIMRIEE